MLTIVMYHYVRDLPRTSFPRIKGLLPARFEGQLDYIARHYTVVGVADVIAATRGAALPENACLLTFDDGLIDHYETVYPILRARGLRAGFYPVAMPVEEHRVLDAHKIHFVLATVGSGRLARELKALLGGRGEELFRRNASPGRRDSADVVFIKRVLQRELPAAERAAITDWLFRRYVTGEESTFARELYMSFEHLRAMARHGMDVGGHGHAHVWLETLSRQAQREEIERTRVFLRRIGSDRDWIMSYPYGSYNADTLELLLTGGAALGLTTRRGVADLARPFELSRLDTNDLPVSSGEPVAPRAEVLA